VLRLWVATQVLGLALALATADTQQLNPLWARRGVSGVATADWPARVRWVNELVDGDGNFLPHLLSIDPTLHCAKQARGWRRRAAESLAP
jgi:hypothetical protein